MLSCEMLKEYAKDFKNYLKSTGKSVHTLSAYQNDLKIFLSFLEEEKRDLTGWSSQSMEYWQYYLEQKGRKSKASQRRALMSSRSFVNFLIQKKVIENSPFNESKSPVQPKHDLLMIPEDKYQELLLLCEERWKNQQDEKYLRDVALVGILGECGLKASEVALLKWKDLWLPAHKEGSVIILGKNERCLTLPLFLVSFLRQVRVLRWQWKLGHGLEDFVFFGYKNLTRAEKIPQIHRHSVKFMLYELCEELLKAPFNAESLRNRAIYKWLHLGLDEEKVAQMAGYSSLNSLSRFSLQERHLRSSRKKKEKGA